MAMAALQSGEEGVGSVRGFSIEEFGVTLLRTGKRTLAILATVGLAAGAAFGLLTPRQYVTSATFIPQSSDNGMSGLELAASQFGIRVPQTGGMWGPPVYVELLRSRELLEPILLDSVTVHEEGDRRAAVIDLLRLPALPLALRTERGVAVLRTRVAVSEEKKLNGVRVSVTTRWPSVSLALAERLVRGVNEFNLSTRKSQATAEREFVEQQTTMAERALLEAEQRLQAFLQRNRSIGGSPDLTFQQDRLQRDVTFRQNMVTTLAQRREEARIREVRDTPVLTVLESPRLAIAGMARRSAMKGVLGALVAVLLGIAGMYVIEGLSWARRDSVDPSLWHFRLLDSALPDFLRRLAR